MRVNNDIFVKLNYKTIGEFKSLIIDRDLGCNEVNKYMMCAGNYNKDGWTFVFKANSVKEAEKLINNNRFSEKKSYNGQDNKIIDEKIYRNKKLRIN
ncbi:hypothetical protein [Clostridium gasigenes]|uniref:hypothetical protein n=1 Tax=Clostridium gasigenes TaxID=94869 RepID=UPI00209AFFB5|nr:hypothetical protein [Clostridium gasigenes]